MQAQQIQLQTSYTEEQEFFGSVVAVSADGNTMAVGTSYDSAAGDSAGAVFIYTRNGSTWTEQARLQASDAKEYAEFGISVALSADGNLLAVGAYGDMNTGGEFAGSVYIFTRTGSTWIEQARLQASDASENDYFGKAVALNADGNILAVGAYLDDHTGGDDAGSVYIFTRVENSWREQARLQASDAAMNDEFGYSVALNADGNTLAVGAHADDMCAGTVYIFNNNGFAWTEQARLQASDAAMSDYFGNSVALSADGNTLAVGAHLDSNSGGENAGSVYIFTRTGSTWTEQTRLQASDAAEGDNFGYAVALSADGNTLAVGAQYDDTSVGADAGSAYIFNRDGSSWVEQVRLQASTAGAQFGYSAAISADGRTLISSSYWPNSADAVDAGSVYIFQQEA